ncbi:MAG: RHS repeat-associated core domain-containing protein, partial [Kiritimatiellae bacterium]|nr:RHS repeat-associated core domain-containing protein [Kiritimatiellia bacterium]
QSGVTNVTRYIWGPDLSGTLQGAGGVGGLLAEVRGDGSVYFPCYDANGNVTDYLDAYGTVRGHFEYDAFGNTVAMWGDLAHTFRFRFSTKYWDAETQSYYYGYRHYAPKLGCWLNRDPIEELGGIHLYVININNCLSNYDYLGLSLVDWFPLSGTLKAIIENMLKTISGQDPDNYPAFVTYRRCCEAGAVIAESECTKNNNDMFYQYARDFSKDAFKGKVLEIIAAIIIRHPAISVTALVDSLAAGINWVDVLNNMRKARDVANEKNCDCSKKGFIPQGW